MNCVNSVSYNKHVCSCLVSMRTYDVIAWVAVKLGINPASVVLEMGKIS